MGGLISAILHQTQNAALHMIQVGYSALHFFNFFFGKKKKNTQKKKLQYHFPDVLTFLSQTSAEHN